MTKTQKTRVRLFALALGLAGLLVPVTVSQGNAGAAVEANEACADDVCCREIGSSCEQDGKLHLNYYPATSCEIEQN